MTILHALPKRSLTAKTIFGGNADFQKLIISEVFDINKTHPSAYYKKFQKCSLNASLMWFEITLRPKHAVNLFLNK